MKLTRQAEIAIDILILCATKGSVAPIITRIAAGNAGTTKDHAAQVVARLTRSGYLASERGRAGGIRRARPAAWINVGAVLRLIDPVLATIDDDASGKAAASAFEVLQQAAGAAFLSTFDGFTVADLVANPAAGRLACLDCDLTTLARQGRTLSQLRTSQPV